MVLEFEYGSAMAMKERCLERLNEMCKNTVDSLFSVWEEIGINEDQIHKQLKALIQCSENFMKRALQDEIRKRDETIKRIETYGEKVLSLCQELSIPVIDPDEDLKMLELEQHLASKVQELNAEKERRLSRFQELCQEDRQLSTSLGTALFSLKFSAEVVPSLEKIQKFQSHLENMRYEKESRMNTFFSIRATIMQLFKDLESKPMSAFESLVVMTPDAFIPTTTHMEELLALERKLRKAVEENMTKAHDLREKLLELWTLLELSLSDREEYLTIHTGYAPSVISDLTKEVKSLKERRQANMHQCIEKIREEIHIWRNKCMISENPNENAADYGECSEETLQSYEKQLKHLKRHFQTYEEVFAKIIKREELWDQMLELEKRGQDPNRFANRGGGLLKEERERKRLMALLPKLEVELEGMVNVKEAEMDETFSVYGQPLMDHIRDKWDAYRQEKENEKAERLTKKAQQRVEEYNGTKLKFTPGKRQPGTPIKRVAKFAKVGVTPSSSVAAPTPLAGQSSNIRGKPPKSVKSCTRKLRVLPRRLHQRSRQGHDANSTFNLFPNAESTIVAGMPHQFNNQTPGLNASTLSSETHFTRNMARKSRKDLNCRSSVATPTKSTPSRYRDNIGLPFLM